MLSTSRARARVLMCWCLLACVTGCMPQEGLQVNATNAPSERNLRPVWGEPIVLPQSPWVVIPFAVESQNQKFGFSPGISSGGFISGVSSASSVGYYTNKAFGTYWQTGWTHWNNAAFYNSATGRSHLLLDHRAVICRAYFPSDTTQPNGKPEDYILFASAQKDTNGDHYINEDDQLTLYYCDLSGAGIQRLTPPNVSFHDLTRAGDPAGTLLLISVRRDTTGSGKFTDGDSDLLRVDLSNIQHGKPILPEELRQKATRLVTAQPEH